MTEQMVDQDRFERFMQRILPLTMPEEQARFDTQGREYMTGLYRRHAQGQSVPQHPQEDEAALQFDPNALFPWALITGAMLGTFNTLVGLLSGGRHPSEPALGPVSERDAFVREAVRVWRSDLVTAGLSPEEAARMADEFGSDLVGLIVERRQDQSG